VRVLLKFSEKLVEQPITALVILEQKVPVNIIGAHIGSEGGEILAEIPTAFSKNIIEAFREKGVVVTVPGFIEVDGEKCFSCGACMSLCPMNAIRFLEDFTVFFDKDKCVGSACGICVDACPPRAIKSVRQDDSQSKE
jgi:ferredoxin